MTKVVDATTALVAVMQALDPLADADRRWVLQAVTSRWSIQAGVPNPALPPLASPAAAPPPVASGEASAAITSKDIRAFMRIKRPATDVERVTCLVYYLIRTTGQPGFKFKDISQANTDYGGTKINMARALDNATRQSKFLSSREAGAKQLTPLGEDVVEALPNREAVTEALATHRVRKGRKKKAAKKK